MNLILASASPRRAEILQAAGLHFTVLPAEVDEARFAGELPHEHVQRLASAKAELSATRFAGPGIILAADTVVAVEGEIFGKPHSTEDARRMLRTLSGRMHSVLTGVTLIRLPDAARRSFVETTHVHFAPLSLADIEEYLATEEPYDKAGAYAIQGRAGRYIPMIEGCYFNVVGLPLARVFQSLRELGLSGS